MPKSRIPLIYTNAFKLRMVFDYLEAAKEGMTRMAFCKLRGINPPTLQTWERKLMKLVEVSSRQGTTTPSRASRLIVVGSGRVSPSTPIEDALVTFVKDARRDEQIVTRDMIVRKATDLLPDVMES
ncbi:hypothetical protein PR003_g5830 [Phytophthora rubi]|nr:hypothetical protein PR003_g5830 [Phytophthora rubi]